MRGGFDRRKSLQELEHSDWGEPDPDATSLIIRCHRLRRKALVDFTLGDLRIMIGQQISLGYLIPIAIEHLEREPLAEADCYPGDLLGAVLSANDSFWQSHSDSHQRVANVIHFARSQLESSEEDDCRCIRDILDSVPRSLIAP